MFRHAWVPITYPRQMLLGGATDRMEDSPMAHDIRDIHMEPSHKLFQNSLSKSWEKTSVSSFWWLIESYHILLVLVLIFESGHNFAHVATAELSLHVQNCDLTISLFFTTCVLYYLDYKLLHHLWNWSLARTFQIIFRVNHINNLKTDWSIEWQIDWLTDWLIDWLILTSYLTQEGGDSKSVYNGSNNSIFLLWSNTM